MVATTPIKLPAVTPSGDSPTFGVGKVEFSADNKYMYTLNGELCLYTSTPEVKPVTLIY